MSSRLPRILWLLTIAYWLFLFTMTHIPRGQAPDIGVNDKLEHFLAYGLLAGALFVCLWATRPRSWRSAWIVPAICLAYGAVEEWLQAIPFINRSCELNDWFADAIGTGLAMLFLVPIRLMSTRRKPASPRAGRCADTISQSDQIRPKG